MNELVKQSGFTLIEMLVYLSLLLMLSVGSVSLLLTLQKTVVEEQAQRTLTQAGSAAMERMLYEIRSGDTITIPMSTLETSPGTLVIEQDGQVVTLATSSQAISLTIDGGATNLLTGSNVSVDSLIFDYYDNTRTELVTIVLTLTSTIGAATSSETFRGSAILHGSYE